MTTLNNQTSQVQAKITLVAVQTYCYEMPPKIPRRTVAQVALKIYANDLEALSFSLSGYGL